MIDGLVVESQVGRLVYVEAPQDRRWRGLPPAGAWVRRGQWALNAARRVAPEAGTWELAGQLRVRATTPTSLAWWTREGLGTRALAPGEVWVLSGRPVAYFAVGAVEPAGCADVESPVDVVVGPDLDRVPADLVHTFLVGPWSVSPQSDRAGIRLAGPPLRGLSDARVPTAPVNLGAVEVPPDGLPIVIGPDGPTTGGYVVPLVVPPYAHDGLVLTPPGARCTFRLVDRETALSRQRGWLQRRG